MDIETVGNFIIKTHFPKG